MAGLTSMYLNCFDEQEFKERMKAMNKSESTFLNIWMRRLIALPAVLSLTLGFPGQALAGAPLSGIVLEGGGACGGQENDRAQSHGHIQLHREDLRV